MVSIDVVLSDIDINQCDDQDSSENDDGENNGIDYTPGKLMEFMGSHLCKPSTEVLALYYSCEFVLVGVT